MFARPGKNSVAHNLFRCYEIRLQTIHHWTCFVFESNYVLLINFIGVCISLSPSVQKSIVCHLTRANKFVHLLTNISFFFLRHEGKWNLYLHVHLYCRPFSAPGDLMYGIIFFIWSTTAWTTCKSQSKNNLLSNFCVYVYVYFLLLLLLLCRRRYCVVTAILEFRDHIFGTTVCMFCQYQLYQHQYYTFNKTKNIFICMFKVMLMTYRINSSGKNINIWSQFWIHRGKKMKKVN